MITRWCVVFLFLCGAAPAAAQPASADAGPAIRRWIDLQHVHLSSRFRWVESNDGRITSSTHQWQPQVRARFLFDREARYSVHVGAFSGSQLVSGWNNSGGGVGQFAGDFNVKQLFFAAKPIGQLELQAGGLYMARGDNTEVTSYDNDAYIVGERAIWAPDAGPIAQVAATVGHIGDYRTPNVFERLDELADLNYAQLLVGFRLGQQVTASGDYTYEDGRDILRQGVTLRTAKGTPVLSAVRFEAYERVAPDTGQGFNLSADLRLMSRFTVTPGVTHIDRNYLIPGYMPPNGDRYERGTRVYHVATYAVSREFSVGWFHGEAFATDYPIPNEHRFEIFATYNPTALLKARGVF
jgi:hypothetical protein